MYLKSKHYLRQIRRLDDIINAKLEQIELLRTMSTKVTTNISDERVQTSGTSDKVGSSIVKIIDLENEINDSIDELIDLKREVLRKIEQIENDDYKLLITLKYLNFKSWEEIAVEMNYSYRHVTRLHGSALIAFENVS